jgi:hypothetical protein
MAKARAASLRKVTYLSLLANVQEKDHESVTTIAWLSVTAQELLTAIKSQSREHTSIIFVKTIVLHGTVCTLAGTADAFRVGSIALHLATRQFVIKMEPKLLLQWIIQQLIAINQVSLKVKQVNRLQ